MRCLLAVLLFVAACTAEPPADAPPATPPANTLGSDADAPTGAPGVPLPTILDSAADPAALLDRLASPLWVEREPVQNRHDPFVTDTVVTRVYRGLEIEVYQTAARPLLRRVAVTSDDYRTADGLTVTSTRDEVRRVLGAPDRTEGDTWYYERSTSPDDSTPPTLAIRFEDRFAQALTWSFYVD